MDVSYEANNLTSSDSLDTGYYDFSTVHYSEYNGSDRVTEISNGTDYLATDWQDWRENFWLLFDERYLRHNLGWTITLIVAYALIFLIGLVGNCMVILVVIKRPQMRTVTNLFIMNLAVADLLVIIFCVPAELLWNIFWPWILGLVECKVGFYMKWVSLSASAYTLAAISIDRCKAIYRPQVPPRGYSKRQVLFTIGLIWTFSLTIAIPVGVTSVILDPFVGICNERWENTLHPIVYFFVVKMFLFFSWPLILIFISNIIIWRTVSRRKAPENCARESQIGRMHRASRQSVGKMLGIVTLMFLLSWLPYYVMVLLEYFIYKYVNRKVANIIWPLLPLLYSSNSCINPVLYAFLSRKFREAFKSLLPKWLPCIRRTESNGEKSCPSRETATNITP